jgi:hypothetical protein
MASLHVLPNTNEGTTYPLNGNRFVLVEVPAWLPFR